LEAIMSREFSGIHLAASEQSKPMELTGLQLDNVTAGTKADGKHIEIGRLTFRHTQS
jgi:hypothetical protein